MAVKDSSKVVKSVSVSNDDLIAYITKNVRTNAVGRAERTGFRAGVVKFCEMIKSGKTIEEIRTFVSNEPFGIAIALCIEKALDYRKSISETSGSESPRYIMGMDHAVDTSKRVDK